MADTEISASEVGDIAPEEPAEESTKAARKEQKKLYGEDFPDPLKATGLQWRAWLDGRVREQEPIMRDKRLYWARNRHFRSGRQWISSRDGRTWREMDADQNTVREVLNILGPALDFRLSIINEQKPGFRAYPLGTGTEGKEVAEAQQRVSEYYFNRLNGTKLMRDCYTSAQTDGVAFLQVYVDKTAGPKKEDVRLIAQEDSRFAILQAEGYEVNPEGFLLLPLSEEGEIAPAGTEVRTFSEGDVATRIVLAHELFFDPEAKTVNGPYDKAKWCIIRRVRDLKSARLETGNTELQSDSSTMGAGDPIMDATDAGIVPTPNTWQRGLPPYPTTRMRNREGGVFDFMLYLAPSEAAGLPDGYWCRIVGNEKIEGDMQLPGKRIPLARMTDGSSDPEMFPSPVMINWIPDQVGINALLSKLLEHVRVFGAGRFMAQRGTVLQETYSTIVGALMEYTGAPPTFLPGLRISQDVWQSLEFLIRKLEDKTGWNDLARGKVGGNGSFQDVSGRAVLGARDLYERQHGPMIRAVAEGMTDWSVLVVDYARYLFSTPRLIPIAGRGDLAKKIKSEDLGEQSMVYVDAETMIPLPRALRNQMLFDLWQQKIISTQEYKQRAPFAEIRDLYMGGSEHWERAQTINTVLEERWEEMAAWELPMRYSPMTGGLPIFWQDDAKSHKQALQELALDEKKPFSLRQIAVERWGIYDQLERSKPMLDPMTGQMIAPPSAPVPQLVIGVPVDIMMQQGLPPIGPVNPAVGGSASASGAGGGIASGQIPGGAAGPSASPTPTLGQSVPEASSQGFAPLGGLGGSENLSHRMEA